MNLIELSRLLLDEKKAEQYLLEIGILKNFYNCDKCGSEKFGRIRRGSTSAIAANLSGIKEKGACLKESI